MELNDIFKPKSKEDIIRDLSCLHEDEYGNTPLMWAAGRGQTSVVKILLDIGVSVNVKSKFGELTAMMRASYYGHKKIVQMLLDAGADINARDADNHTALQYAIGNDHTDIANLLKIYGAKL